jgi:SNF2 family DNA or RNA helicase
VHVCDWLTPSVSLVLTLVSSQGLGKTVSVVAHLLHLRSVHTRGPYLVIVPLSTLPHWKREFDTWSHLNSVVFQGSKEDREFVKNYEWNFWANEDREYDGQTTLVNTEYKFDVLLCTYESILSETTFLARVPWKIIVVDEAHRLKNAQSRLFKALKLFQTDHRLLMTGTPIQNDIGELWTLLNVIEPNVFASIHTFQEQYGVLEKNEQVKQLQASLSPYLLRRMKEDVATSIPPREETIVQVELTILQKVSTRDTTGCELHQTRGARLNVCRSACIVVVVAILSCRV